MNPVEQLQSFEQDRIIVLREAWRKYRGIAEYAGRNVSVVCRCFYQRSAGHSHIHEPGLDGEVQTHVKIDELCVWQFPPEQLPGKKSEHILCLLW